MSLTPAPSAPSYPGWNWTAFSLSATAFIGTAALYGWNGHERAELLLQTLLLVTTLGLAVLGVVLGFVAMALAGRGSVLPTLAVVCGLFAIGVLIPKARDRVAALGQEFNSTAHAPVLARANPSGLAAPLPALPQARTFRSLRPMYQGWTEREIVEPYRRLGRHDPRWEADALALIQGTMWRALDAPDAPSPRELQQTADRLASSGCNDPLALFLASRWAFNSTRRTWLLQRALPELQASRYPPAILFLAEVERYAELRATSALKAEDTARVLSVFGKVFSDHPWKDEDYWVLLSLLHEGHAATFCADHGDEVCHLLETVPQSEPWVKEIFSGEWELELAWRARGSNTADKVTTLGWAGFKRHLELARAHLEHSWQLHPQHPAAASDMIRVCMGQSQRAELRTWLERALAAQFDYQPAFQRYRWAIRPRWLGSEAIMLDFGRACLHTGRFDTVVPQQMVQVVRDLASEQDDPQQFYLHRAPWADLNAMIEGYLHEPSMAASRSYFLSLGAVLADKCRADAGRIWLRQIDYTLNENVAAEFDLNAQEWPRQAAVELSPVRYVVQDAAEFLQKGQIEQAMAKLQLAEATPGLDTGTRAVIASNLEAARLQLSLSKVPWRPFLPSPTLEGWRIQSGLWTVPAPGVLQARADAKGAHLAYLPPVGSVFEIRGRMEFVEEITGLTPKGHNQCGFLYGHPEKNGDHWLSLHLSRGVPETTRAVYARRADLFLPISATLRPKVENDFLLRVYGRHLSLMLNGQSLLQDYVVPGEPVGDAASTIALVGHGAIDNTVRYRNLEIRTLPVPKTGP